VRFLSPTLESKVRLDCRLEVSRERERERKKVFACCNDFPSPLRHARQAWRPPPCRCRRNVGCFVFCGTSTSHGYRGQASSTRLTEANAFRHPTGLPPPQKIKCECAAVGSSAFPRHPNFGGPTFLAGHRRSAGKKNGTHISASAARRGRRGGGEIFRGGGVQNKNLPTPTSSSATGSL
jgi:hypothetical protein